MENFESNDGIRNGFVLSPTKCIPNANTPYNGNFADDRVLLKAILIIITSFATKLLIC